jgi:hypothetical protein
MGTENLMCIHDPKAAFLIHEEPDSLCPRMGEELFLEVSGNFDSLKFGLGKN